MADKNVFASGEATLSMSFDDGATFLKLDNVESFGISMDNELVDWNKFGNGGWKENLVTGKSISASVERKYTPADEADKKLVEIFFGDAEAHNGLKLKLELPVIVETNTTPASIEFTGSISISDTFSNGATEVSPFNFDFNVSGAPIYVAEAA